ncbi:MAG: GtrA family protein, partial [Bacteroidetes bacterium]|nr:GtrA family protein [Bacteroidota bacterium]
MKFVVTWARHKLSGYPLLKKLIKFGLVGFTAAVISILIHWLIILQYPQMNLVGKAIGSIVGFFVGYALNRIWTYVDRTDDDQKYLGKYFIVYLVTFFIYLLLNFFFDHYFLTQVIYISKEQPFNFILFSVVIKREVLSNVIS